MARHARRHQRGSVLIEFAFIAPLFFLLLAAICDFSYLLYVNLTMQHAVREGARTAAVQGNYSAALAMMQDQSMGLWSTLSPAVSVAVVNGSGSTTALPALSVGSSSDIIIVNINCTTTLLTGLVAAFFPGGIVNFNVSATIRNE
jgi:Flp pilus assembly protein TadG